MATEIQSGVTVSSGWGGGGLEQSQWVTLSSSVQIIQPEMLITLGSDLHVSRVVRAK